MIERLGAGFLLVIVLSSFKPLARCLAWTLCFERPQSLRVRDALRAYLIGDAVGNVLPVGILVSEPAKAVLVRDRVPLVESFSALAVENLFYSLSVALFIFSGTAALLLNFPLAKPLRYASMGVLFGIAMLILLAGYFLRKQPKFLSGALESLYRRGLARRYLETRRERVRSVEERIYGFYRRNRARFLPILLVEASFHLAGVLEVYVILLLITGTAPAVLTAFVLEAVNRVVNVAFKFITLRVGVDEVGTGMVTRILNFGTASGVALAILRKARILVWTAIGFALLAHRGLTLRAVTEEAQQAAADKANDAPDVAGLPTRRL